MPIPALPLFKHRDTVVTPADQNQFVTQFETTMDTMSNDVIPAINTSISDMNTQYNNIYNNLPFAPDSGYSQAYIDTNIYKKTETYNKTEVDTAISDATLDINTLPDKPTPVDADNLALQEAGGLLKKLSFANLKNWILSLFNPTLTANATLTGIDNKIVMNGIVTSLGLEVGDVIQFTSVANANNQKMRTVESIINNNEIIVNYEHCGNRGNGTLKLTDETLTNATVKRISKYYNAPIDLGRDYVSTLSLRTIGATFTNNTNRALSVSLVGSNTTNEDAFDLTQGGKVIARGTKQGSASAVRPSSANGTLVANKDWSIVRTSGSGALTSLEELR